MKQMNFEIPERRKRIITEARKEFFANGFRATDLSDFASELGLSKKTIYVEFKNKRELISQILIQKTKEVQRDLSQLLEKTEKDSSAEIKTFLNCIQNHLSEIKPVFLRDLSKFHPELFDIVVQARRQIIPKYFGELITRGQKSGVIRSDIPTKNIVEIFLVVIESVVNPERLNDLSISPKKAFSQVLSVIMDGVKLHKRNTK